MKVLFQGIGGGKVILNPTDTMSLIRASKFKAGGVIIHFEDMVVSTEPMLPHDALFDIAGFEEVPFTPGQGFAKDFSHRAAMDEKGLSVDIWMTEPSDDFPYTREEMDDLLSHLQSHRRLKRMPEGFELEIIVHDDCGSPAFSYTREGLAKLDHKGKRQESIEFPANTLTP